MNRILPNISKAMYLLKFKAYTWKKNNKAPTWDIAFNIHVVKYVFFFAIPPLLLSLGIPDPQDSW